MSKATSGLIAAVALLALTGGAYAQGNNTLATPTTQSPAKATSGYGTPGVTESGAGSSSAQRNSADTSSTSMTPAYGVNNTLATPTTKSPAGQ